MIRNAIFALATSAAFLTPAGASEAAELCGVVAIKAIEPIAFKGGPVNASASEEPATTNAAGSGAGDLFLVLGSEQSRGASIDAWVSGETTPLRPGASFPVEGAMALVPYVLGLMGNGDRVAVELRGGGTGQSRKRLGQAVFAFEDAGKGELATFVLSPDEDGVAYGIRYEVVPMVCSDTISASLRGLYAETTPDDPRAGDLYRKAFQAAGFAKSDAEREMAGLNF
ncbi:hypothetical protein [Jiella marina]|uniref:hypothetical protein n=1 Tax=Jiella sp. LLJ827 TaxID=2917712 RepID=UPI002101A7A7|nr:hypothetical protein [Jiella sp. LLJ827]MCQ0990577.1 hypothetical protein [Jiella sp. LLJ827]